MGCVSQDGESALTVRNVTPSLVDSKDAASGIAYWVPLTEDIDSFPVAATDVAGIDCSSEQAAWLASIGTPVLTPQDIVVKNNSDQHVAVTVESASTGSAPAATPGFYVQCGELDVGKSAESLSPYDGEPLWPAWVDVTAGEVVGDLTNEEVVKFQQSIAPGKSLDIRVFLNGEKPFHGRVDLKAVTDDGKLSSTSLPLFDGPETSTEITWPGVPAGSLLVHPYRLQSNDDQTVMYCNLNGTGWSEHKCSTADMVGLVAYALDDLTIVDDYLSRRAGSSDCRDVEKDQEIFIDALHPYATYPWPTTVETLEMVAHPFETLKQHCSEDYVEKVLGTDDFMMRDIKWHLMPPAVLIEQPSWVDCGAVTAMKGGSWEGAPAGSVSICENGSVIVRIDGQFDKVFYEFADGDGEWTASNDTHQIFGDIDLSYVTIVPNDGRSIHAYNLLERWW
jgi:hypothetical protein